jgi:quinol monooxygenase YgiN
MKKLMMGILMSMIAGGASAAESPLLLTATVKIQQGKQEAFKAELLSILAPTRAEAGNISYNAYQSPNDPTEFTTVEMWKSQAAIDEHMTSPHMQVFFGKVGPFFAPGFPILKTYQTIEK